MSSTYALGLIGSVVTLVALFELLRRRRIREKYAVLWVGVALVTLAIAVFPQLLDRTAELLGVAVPANLLFFGASMLLLVVSIQHSYELGRLEDHTRTLAEEVALLRLDLESLAGRDPAGSAPSRPSTPAG
jgi:hypothetical protein